MILVSKRTNMVNFLCVLHYYVEELIRMAIESLFVDTEKLSANPI